MTETRSGEGHPPSDFNTHPEAAEIRCDLELVWCRHGVAVAENDTPATWRVWHVGPAPLCIATPAFLRAARVVCCSTTWHQAQLLPAATTTTSSALNRSCRLRWTVMVPHRLSGRNLGCLRLPTRQRPMRHGAKLTLKLAMKLAVPPDRRRRQLHGPGRPSCSAMRTATRTALRSDGAGQPVHHGPHRRRPPATATRWICPGRLMNNGTPAVAA